MIGLWRCKDCGHEWEGAGGQCELCDGGIKLLAHLATNGRIIKWYSKENPSHPAGGRTLGRRMTANVTNHARNVK